MSVSFTGGEAPAPEGGAAGYIVERSVLGRVYIPEEGILVTGPVRIRYEKYPWIEKFETDGLRAAPARRTGIGTKGAKGFVTSLSTIYSRAYDEYREFGGDEAFDAEKYFGHAAEWFVSAASDKARAKQFAKFCGFTENMWREGDRRMLDIAMKIILPVLTDAPETRKMFYNSITQEFREYISDNS